VRGAVLPAPAGLGWIAAVRQRMVQRWPPGIQSPAVLQAMGQVERHALSTALVNQAYEDTSLPIGPADHLQAQVVARMIELLLRLPAAPSPRLGACWRSAPAAATRPPCWPAGREVYSIERLRGLHEKARSNLRPMRLSNVHLILGDGMVGFARARPMRASSAAGGGEWCRRPGAINWPWGRLVAPTVLPTGKQALVVIDKTPQGLRRRFEAVHFVPLKSGIARRKAYVGIAKSWCMGTVAVLGLLLCRLRPDGPPGPVGAGAGVGQQSAASASAVPLPSPARR
jgi:protein-L-isoaspartate(D-aspartate) O-methyltransferase